MISFVVVVVEAIVDILKDGPQKKSFYAVSPLF